MRREKGIMPSRKINEFGSKVGSGMKIVCSSSGFLPSTLQRARTTWDGQGENV